MRQFNNLGRLLIFSIVSILSCQVPQSTQNASMILDLTEKYFQVVTVREFKKVSFISKSENNGEETRIRTITEIGFNAIETFQLDTVGNILLNNEYNRSKEVEKYFFNIDSTLNKIQTERRKREGSIIYKIISEELNYLHESKTDKKLLIIYSDLMELSFINFYDSVILNLIKTEPLRIQNVLIDKYPIPDLSGIQVFLVYKPINKDDSERFEIVSQFYKSMFEKRGAKVTITANL